jgi:hypothetical protein
MAQPRTDRLRRRANGHDDGGHMRRALVLLTTVGFLVTACASGTEGTPTSVKQAKSTTTTSRAPFDGERLDDGEVVKVDKLDGIRLEPPDDGRLRNYGVGVDVLDFGTADIVDAGQDLQYGAGDDSTLLAFRLQVTPFAEDDDISQQVTATVSVDGRQRSLPDFEYALGDPGEDTTLQYLVAVPNDRREVTLELKYADLAQTYDLLEGKRTGEQPKILYRSPDAPFVYVENLTPAKLSVRDKKDQEPGTYVVAVTRAELTYFTADLGDTPSDKGKAWLVITYEATGEGSLEDNPSASACTVPFANFTVTDSKGTYPVVDKHSSMEIHKSEKTLVFEVPAELTDATLSLKTPGFQCDNTGWTDEFASDGASADIKMTLPED